MTDSGVRTPPWSRGDGLKCLIVPFRSVLSLPGGPPEGSCHSTGKGGSCGVASISLTSVTRSSARRTAGLLGCHDASRLQPRQGASATSPLLGAPRKTSRMVNAGHLSGRFCLVAQPPSIARIDYMK
jgi:hypothetical protein